MKKFIFVCVVFLTFILISSVGAQKIQIGVLGGPNFADMNLKSESGEDQITSSQTYFGIGGTADLQIGPFFNVQVEPMYLRKGGQAMASNGDPNIDIKMNFIEIPVFLKFAFGQIVKPYVKAGPTIGFLLNSTAEAEIASPGSAPVTYEADLKNVLESMDIGLGVGAGVTIPFGNNTLFVDGRYTFGLTDLYKGGSLEWKSGSDSFTVDASEAAELSNKGIQVMLGIMFPMGLQ